METNASTHDDATRPCPTDPCRRDLEAAVRSLDGVTTADVAAAAENPVTTAVVPETHDRRVFEVTGLDCPACAGLVEVALARRGPVSNVTASHGQGTVRVDYDPEATAEADLRTALSDLGYPVETTDEAFAARRARQWAEARFAAGILGGLMVLAPYAAVIYPTRFDLPFYDPVVLALLERALDSLFASHFYLNLAVLSGFVLVFTGRPVLADAAAALRERSPNRSLAVVSVAVGLYAYSSLAAFPLAFEGGVYYDVVVALVVGTTVARRSGTDVLGTASDDEPAETAGAAVAEGGTE